MASFSRTDRISEEIKRELANIIRELKDPRIPQLVSVTKVEVTKDLSYAKAYISVLGDEKVQKDTIAGLKSASGFIKKEIAHRVKLRTIPEFSFIADDSIAYGSHISEVLKRL